MSDIPERKNYSVVEPSDIGTYLDSDLTQGDPARDWSAEDWEEFFTGTSRNAAISVRWGNPSDDAPSAATDLSTAMTEGTADGTCWSEKLERKGEYRSVNHIAMVESPRLIMPPRNVLTHEASDVKPVDDGSRKWFYRTVTNTAQGLALEVVDREAWPLRKLLEMLRSPRGEAWLANFGNAVIDLPSLRNLDDLYANPEFLEFLPAGARSWFRGCICLTVYQVRDTQPCDEPLRRCLYETIPGVIAAWEAEQREPGNRPGQMMIVLSLEPAVIDDGAFLTYHFESTLGTA